MFDEGADLMHGLSSFFPVDEGGQEEIGGGEGYGDGGGDFTKFLYRDVHRYNPII